MPLECESCASRFHLNWQGQSEMGIIIHIKPIPLVLSWQGAFILSEKMSESMVTGHILIAYCLNRINLQWLIMPGLKRTSFKLEIFLKGFGEGGSVAVKRFLQLHTNDFLCVLCFYLTNDILNVVENILLLFFVIGNGIKSCRYWPVLSYTVLFVRLFQKEL